MANENKTLPLLFNDLVALDKEKHKELKFNRNIDYSHSKDVHFLPVVVGEVGLLSPHYPVAFAKVDQDTYALTAIVGFKKDTNSYINEEGQWLADYVPLYVRKYPFAGITVKGEESKKVMCFDPKAPHLNDKEGEKLFNEDGQPSEVVNIALQMAEEYDLSSSQTRTFCDAVAEANILEVRSEASEYGAVEFFSVKIDALATMTPKKIKEWQENGYLAVLAHIINSQRSWRELEVRARYHEKNDKKDDNLVKKSKEKITDKVTDKVN